MLLRCHPRLYRPKLLLLHNFKQFYSIQKFLVEPGQTPAFDQAVSFLQSQGIDPQKISDIELFRNGLADFSKPEFQKLGLQHFIGHRRDHMVLFAKQRHIFADYFPSADFNAEIHVSSKTGDLFEYCNEYPPALMKDPIQFNLQVYHPEEKLYTFLLLDGDYPYLCERRVREHILWMKINQEISASSVSPGTELHPYLPPHPAKGTGKHRIVSLLLEQETELDVPTPSRKMVVWDFIKKNKLKPRGLHIFYTQWDASVTSVFAKHLNMREPEFIPPPPKEQTDGLDKPTFSVI